MFRRVLSFHVANDLVNHLHKRGSCVDYDAVFRNVFLRLMQSHNEVPFRLLSTPFIVQPLVKPSIQCVEVNIKDKHSIK
jgi:hypothetical protein